MIEDGSVTTAATGYELLLYNLSTAKAADPVVPATVAAAEKALENAGLRAGVDLTPPGIEIAGGKRVAAADALAFSIDVYDGRERCQLRYGCGAAAGKYRKA